MSLARPLGLGRRSAASDLKQFLKLYHLEEKDVVAEKETAVAYAVGQWSRHLRAGRRSRTAFAISQPVAPIAAATATVLAAFKSTSAWAVIPSAAATVAASMLAAFGFRQLWLRRYLVQHALGEDIAEFIMGWGDFRGLSTDEQIDRLMSAVREATKTVAQRDN